MSPPFCREEWKATPQNTLIFDPQRDVSSQHFFIFQEAEDLIPFPMRSMGKFGICLILIRNLSAKAREKSIFFNKKLKGNDL